MKYNHLLVKFEFHALVATRPSAAKLMMKAPDIKVCKVKAVVFRNMKSGSVRMKTAASIFRLKFVSRRRHDFPLKYWYLSTTLFGVTF
jgi:hypothetical protein